jgi:hypothetical protein
MIAYCDSGKDNAARTYQAALPDTDVEMSHIDEVVSENCHFERNSCLFANVYPFRVDPVQARAKRYHRIFADIHSPDTIEILAPRLPGDRLK